MPLYSINHTRASATHGHVGPAPKPRRFSTEHSTVLVFLLHLSERWRFVHSNDLRILVCFSVMTMKGASWRGRRVNDGGESHALSERERVVRPSLFQRALRGGFLVLFLDDVRVLLWEKSPRLFHGTLRRRLERCRCQPVTTRRRAVARFDVGSMRRPRTDAVLATIPRPVRHCRLKKITKAHQKFKSRWMSKLPVCHAPRIQKSSM